MSTLDPDRLPQRDGNHALEERSRIRFAAVFCGALFRIVSEKGTDYGVDIQVEALLDNGKSPSNIRALFQLKARTFEANADGSFSEKIKITNLNYLLNSRSSAYVLYHEPTGRFYFRYAAEVFEDAEARRVDWKAQSTVVVRWTNVVDEAFLILLHRQIVEDARRDREYRLAAQMRPSLLADMGNHIAAAKELDANFKFIAERALDFYERALGNLQESDSRRADDFFTAAISMLKSRALDASTSARIYVSAAGVKCLRHEIKAAEQYANSAISVLDQVKPNRNEDDVVRAWAEEILGHVACIDNNWEEAARRFRAAEEIFRKSGDLSMLANTLLTAANSALDCGHVDAAVQLCDALHGTFKTAEERSVTLPPYIHVCGTALLGNLALQASIYAPTKELQMVGMARAGEMLHEVLEIAQESGIQDLLVKTRFALAQHAWWSGDADAALDQYACLCTSDNYRDFPREYMHSVYNRALILCEQGRPSEAYPLLIEARTLYEKSGDVRSVLQVDGVILKIRK